MRIAGCHSLKAAFCLTVVVSCVCAAQMPETARGLVEQGQLAEAYSRLTAYVREHPTDPRALILLASLELDGTRSQDYYRRSLQSDDAGSTAPTALLAIANHYFALGFSATAHRYARQVMASFPSSTEAKWATILAGRCLLAGDEAEEAAEVLEPMGFAPSEATLSAAATGVWAEAMLAAGRRQEAIRLLSRPEWSRSPYHLAILQRAYVETGQQSRASAVASRIALERREFRRIALAGSESRIPPADGTAPEIPPPQDVAHTPDAEEPVHSIAEAPEDKPAAETDNSFRGGPRGFSVQLGAFRSEENALRLQRTVRAAGYEVVVWRTGSLHRVWAGNYATAGEARAVLPELTRVSGLAPALVRNR